MSESIEEVILRVNHIERELSEMLEEVWELAVDDEETTAFLFSVIEV